MPHAACRMPHAGGEDTHYRQHCWSPCAGGRRDLGPLNDAPDLGSTPVLGSIQNIELRELVATLAKGHKPRGSGGDVKRAIPDVGVTSVMGAQPSAAGYQG